MSWPVPGTLMIEPTESESKVLPPEVNFFSDFSAFDHHLLKKKPFVPPAG